ncbi:MAG: DUF72 domain-containing protein [Chloroflexota bacterium]
MIGGTAAERVYLGCAGWAIPRASAASLPEAGSHLERYAARLPAVEINATFYRLPRPQTLVRWAEAVPEGFRFALKAPREITHRARLREIELLDPFLDGIQALGQKLAVLLIQLPPSLEFEGPSAAAFFSRLRRRWSGGLSCEPRHPSWFRSEAERLLEQWRVARVAADPAPLPEGVEPGGWPGLVYFRLHGSPRRYYSSYSPAFLEALSRRLAEHARQAEVWCIFDNTASGAAIVNVLEVQRRMHAQPCP